MVYGYRKEIFIDPVDSKYLCAVCELVLRNPRQNQCGHRFCQTCAEDAVRRGQTICRLCEQEASVTEVSTVDPSRMFPDRAVLREIEQKKVHCPNPSCTFQGLCKNYDEHERTCVNIPVVCPQCNLTVAQPLLEQHVQRECPERIIHCRFCGTDFRNAIKEHHNYSCPKFPLRCEVCGKTKIPRDCMNDHVLNECPTGCPYQLVGCSAEPRKNTQGHMRENTHQHQLQVIRSIADVKDKVDNLEETRFATIEAKIDSLLTGEGASRGGGAGDEQVQELMGEVIVDREVIKVLRDDMRGLVSACEQYHLRAEVAEKKIKELEGQLRQHERILSLKEVALAEQDLRLKSLELTSYDGTLLWKISDFKKKHEDACAQRSISLYSPAFYTSRNGYKMCARIYLNGDGMGKNSHISLFFVIMRGHFDNLLKWPFRQKVTFMLLDQNHHEHVIDAFRPDPNSSSFKCPTSEMNIASGCPLFVPLTHLENPKSQYVKDDTIFIKIIVDCSDLS